MAFMFIAAVLALCCRVFAGKFGVTERPAAFLVDTGADFTFEVNKSNGDITSLLYRGVQYQGAEKGTHINSGLGPSVVSARKVGQQYVVITIRSNGNPVTQYYVAKMGESNIYIATDITGEVQPGELRFLVRLRKSAAPIGVHFPAADHAGGVEIEGQDVFRIGSQTRCKFYSSVRFIDDTVHTVQGASGSVSLIMPEGAYETVSGGPFMRDINNQGTSDQQEFSFYMNSGHLRTEPWRLGLKGPYVLSFSQSPPSKQIHVDTSFFAGLAIPGYVPATGRGHVSGTASGVPGQFQTVLHWYNAQNQYWTYGKKNGAYQSPAMKPGTYTMVLYKQELAVAQSSVKVTAGTNTPVNIASKEAILTPIWRVGEFDGQPFELKNGDKFLTMHPSDSRMERWGGNFTVGVSSPRDFPMAIFNKIGGPGNINFDLTAAQAKLSTVLRVGTTLSFAGGRPVPTIGTWTGAIPPIPRNLDSRGVTRGGYRGLGEIYTFPIPIGVLKAGKNVLSLGAAGGAGAVDFLSANFVVDAVELIHA